MAEARYRVNKELYSGDITVARGIDTDYDFWTPGRMEWFQHPDAFGAFVGFADGIWHSISEEEAMAITSQQDKESAEETARGIIGRRNG